MSTINLLDALSKLLNCEIVALHDYMNHPLAGNKIDGFLKDKNIRTTYFNRAREQKIVSFGGFSMKPACQQAAYEGYLGVSVQQHFYCRHRIRLMYPRLRCVIEYGKSGHNKYYPLELLELFTPSLTDALSLSVGNATLESFEEEKSFSYMQNDIYSPLADGLSHSAPSADALFHSAREADTIYPYSISRLTNNRTSPNAALSHSTLEDKEKGGKLLIDESKWSFLNQSAQTSQHPKVESWYSCHYGQ